MRIFAKAVPALAYSPALRFGAAGSIGAKSRWDFVFAVSSVVAPLLRTDAIRANQ